MTAREAWLAVLLDPPILRDQDYGLLVQGRRIIVVATRPGTGVSTKCASLRAYAEKVGLASKTEVVDGGVVTEALLAELAEATPYQAAILLIHKGATAAETTHWLGRLGRASRAENLIARYPWQGEDDVWRGRAEVIRQLDQAVYRYIISQLPENAPELRALRRYAETMQAAARKYEAK